jgi:hypothetical protein
MCAQNVLLLAAVLLLLRSTSAEVSLTPQQQQIYEALLPLHMADVPVTEQQPNTCASSDEDMEQLYKVVPVSVLSCSEAIAVTLPSFSLHLNTPVVLRTCPFCTGHNTEQD